MPGVHRIRAAQPLLCGPDWLRRGAGATSARNFLTSVASSVVGLGRRMPCTAVVQLGGADGQTPVQASTKVFRPAGSSHLRSACRTRQAVSSRSRRHRPRQARIRSRSLLAGAQGSVPRGRGAGQAPVPVRCHCTTEPLNGCARRPTARRTARHRRVERPAPAVARLTRVRVTPAQAATHGACWCCAPGCSLTPGGRRRDAGRLMPSDCDASGEKWSQPTQRARSVASGDKMRVLRRGCEPSVRDEGELGAPGDRCLARRADGGDVVFVPDSATSLRSRS